MLRHQIKKVPQLEEEVGSLKHANSVQLSIHQAEIQRLRQKHEAQLKDKEAFYDSEKGRVLFRLPS